MMLPIKAINRDDAPDSPDCCSLCNDEWNGVHGLEVHGFPKSHISICDTCLNTLRKLPYSLSLDNNDSYREVEALGRGKEDAPSPDILIQRVREAIAKLPRYDLDSDGACGDPDCCGAATYSIEKMTGGDYLERKAVVKALRLNPDEENVPLRPEDAEICTCSPNGCPEDCCSCHCHEVEKW